MRPKKLTIKKGETLSRYWRLRNKDTGETLDLSTIGFTSGILAIKDAYYGEDVIEPLTTDNGGVVIEYAADAKGAYWSGRIYLSADQTDALEEWGEGVFDFEISDGLRVKNVAEGIAVLRPTTIT